MTNLMKSTSFDRDSLNPALATASTLRDASMVFHDVVLKRYIILSPVLICATIRNMKKKGIYTAKHHYKGF